MLPNDIMIVIFDFILGRQKDWFILVPYQNVCFQWKFIIDYLFQKNFSKRVKLPNSLIEFHINDPGNYLMISWLYVDGDININQLPKMLNIIYRWQQITQIGYYKPFPDCYKIIIWEPDFHLNSSLKQISHNGKLTIEIRCATTNHRSPPVFFSSQPRIRYFDKNQFGYFLLKIAQIKQS